MHRREREKLATRPRAHETRPDRQVKRHSPPERSSERAALWVGRPFLPWQGETTDLGSAQGPYNSEIRTGHQFCIQCRSFVIQYSAHMSIHLFLLVSFCPGPSEGVCLTGRRSSHLGRGSAQIRLSESLHLPSMSVFCMFHEREKPRTSHSYTFEDPQGCNVS